MCGICGIFEPAVRRIVQRATLKAMADTIRHRGPDDEGFYMLRRRSGWRTGGCRSSISKAATSRSRTKTGSIWIVFNGEIYNFEELNRRYLSSGHTFETRSDTETIVHLYEELGEDCFAELRGMFALALWDGRKKRLLLARDRHRQEAAVLFLGRPAAGLRLRDQGAVAGRRHLDRRWTWRRCRTTSRISTFPRRRPSIAACASCARRTIWSSTRAASARSRTGTSVSTRPEQLSEAEWCEALLGEFRTAVQVAAGERRAAGRVPQRRRGFVVRRGADERASAAGHHLLDRVQRRADTTRRGTRSAFAASLGANHFEHIVEPHAIDLMPKLAWHYDEPFARFLGDADLLRLEGGAAARHRGAFGRRRRRELRRLPPLQADDVGGPAALACSRAGAPRASSGRWAILSEAGLGAARVPREVDVPESCAVADRRLFLRHLVLSAGAEAAAVERATCCERLNGYDSADVLRYHYDRADTPIRSRGFSTST